MFVENIVLITFSLIIIQVNSAKSHNIEGHVVEGEVANIKDFPHAALLGIECVLEESSVIMATCGSSILNQAILITAGHCLDDCVLSYSTVTAFVGSNLRMAGTPYLSSGFKIHEGYDTNKMSNDIALVKLKKSLTFGETVRRVSLRRNPSYNRKAYIAGWGCVDVDEQITSMYLMKIRQRIWGRKNCNVQLNHYVPKGAICGGEMDASSYIAPGDSGSGLIVAKYILVGVVSFKVPGLSKSLSVYTEAAYFYDWLKKNAGDLYCGED